MTQLITTISLWNKRIEWILYCCWTAVYLFHWKQQLDWLRRNNWFRLFSQAANIKPECFVDVLQQNID